MTAESFFEELKVSPPMEPDENVFLAIWGEYERVIIESLVTSFGLDFLVGDRHGGDVDTIHNVRKINSDSQLVYKNKQNEIDYNNRGEYDSVKYHEDSRYKNINRKVSEQKKSGTLKDAYTRKIVAKNAKIDLDHVVAAKEIHDDPGRVLAGLDGKDLANAKVNLCPTDRTINRSMQAKDMEEYLIKLKENQPERQSRIKSLKDKKTLTDKEKKELSKLEKMEEIDPNEMQRKNQEARRAKEKKINKKYYTSEKFAVDTAKAAGKRGLQMGTRQVLGLVFVEIWFAAKNKVKSMPSGCDLKNIIEAAGSGIKEGLENAKAKYKEIIDKFLEGFSAGALASLTTTLCNIFFTTAKNLVRCIRQIYASVIQAGKILLFNPDELPLGTRIKTATIILATGASVLVGTIVGELIGTTPLGMIPVVGDIVQVFCSTLVSGLLSCSLLIFLDRSKFMNAVINALNDIPSEVNNFKEIADAMEYLAAKLANLDIEKFRKDSERYSEVAMKINGTESEEELTKVLLSAYKIFDIPIPWHGNFDSFMENKSNKLVFE